MTFGMHQRIVAVARVTRVLALLAGLVAAEVTVASAQSLAPPGSGLIAPPTSPIERVQPQPQPAIVPNRIEAPPPPPSAEGGLPVTIAAVAIDGATVYSKAELQAFFAGIKGATVTRNQVAELVRALQTKYRNDDYFLTVVQEILEPAPEEGTLLRVRVTEGYISDVKIEGDVGPVEVLVYDFLNHLTQSRPARLSEVERYVLLAQSIPGITIRTVLRAARDEPGAIELVAQLQKKDFDGLVIDDNRGPRTAGPNEMLVAAGANSFTTLGERSQVFIYDTPFDDEQVYGQFSVEGFVGPRGLKLKGYVGYGTSKPGNVLAATGFRSNILLAGGVVTYPAILTRGLALSLFTSLDFNQSTISLYGSNGSLQPEAKTRLRVLRIGENFKLQDDLFGLGRSAVNTFDLTVHRGLPQLVGAPNTQPFVARPGERNDFYKFTTQAIRVQNLGAWRGRLLALKLAFAGQWSPAILPPSEKFLLGGEEAGRGYFSGEVTGDRAAGGTVELQLNDSVDGDIFGQNYHVGLQYYGFYDIGQAWENAHGAANGHVESTGVGIRANLTQWLSAQVEGAERFTRRPNGAIGSLEPEHAAFFRLFFHF